MGLKTELKLGFSKLKYYIKFGTPYFSDESFFKNKRIIIVGAADSSMSYMSGEDIDKFDIIVRINNTPLIADQYPERLGSRTDVLFHCLNSSSMYGDQVLSQKVVDMHKVRHILYPEGRHKGTRKFYQFALSNPLLPFKRLPPKFWKDSIKERKKRFPTTGTLALLYLMERDFKELHITGFTFYKTNYVKAYDNVISQEVALSKANEYHDPERDFEEFIEKYQSSIIQGKKIVLDDTLESLIHKHSNNQESA